MPTHDDMTSAAIRNACSPLPENTLQAGAPDARACPRHDSDVLSVTGPDDAHAGLMVCGVCGELFDRTEPSEVAPRPQRCDCHRTPEDPRWEGFDFNEHSRLCLCCGRAVLRSGSRWSVWFCEGCKEPIRGFNLTYGRTGVAVIPIGRHSMMNHLGLNPGKGGDVRQARALVVALKAIADRTEHLFSWGRERVRDNLRIIDLKDAEVPLRDYLALTERAAMTDARLGREAALLGLFAHFGAPMAAADIPVLVERIEAWKKRSGDRE